MGFCVKTDLFPMEIHCWELCVMWIGLHWLALSPSWVFTPMYWFKKEGKWFQYIWLFGSIGSGLLEPQVKKHVEMVSRPVQECCSWLVMSNVEREKENNCPEFSVCAIVSFRKYLCGNSRLPVIHVTYSQITF